MSENMVDWLNNNIKLSKQISSIENDFSNGYLIGELLQKFRKITTFNEFNNDNEKETKRKNFSHLELAFRQFDIRLDSKTIEEISNKKKGVALRVLYQLRAELNRMNLSFENIRLRSSNKIVDCFNALNHEGDTKKINYEFISKNQGKTIREHSSANQVKNNFETFAMIQAKKQNNDINAQKEMLVSERNMKIEEFKGLKNVQKSRLVAKDREQLLSWEDNLKAMRTSDKKREDIIRSEETRFKEKLLKVICQSEKAQLNQIELFSKNLARMGLDIGNVEDIKGKKPKNVAPMMSSEMVIQKIREKIEKDQNAKKERDRRIRKIAVEQVKTQALLESEKNKEKLKTTQSNEKTLSKMVVSQSNEIENQEEKVILEENEEVQLSEKELLLKEVQKMSYKRIDREVAKKMKKRELTTEISKEILNLIINVAEDAFTVQGQTNNDLIDKKIWDDWMNKFIMNPTESEFSDNIYARKATEMNPSRNMNESIHESELIKEENEFFNYLNFISEWSLEILKNFKDNMMNLYEIYNDNPQSVNEKTNKLNNKKLKEEFELDIKEQDKDNLVIHKDQVRNTIFGDMIDQLIDLRAPETKQTNRNIFSYIPLKIAMIGHSFAGKRTQAKILSDTFGIKVYVVDEILNKSNEILEKLETPIESHPKFKTFKKNQIDAMIEEKQKEEIKYSEIKQIAIKIRELKNEDSITEKLDELIVDLMIEWIRFDFPEKNEQSYIEELSLKHKRKKEIIEELTKIKEEQEKNKKGKVKVKEEQSLTAELSKINQESSKGFVLVDFPKTYNQAYLFEKKLTGFIHEIDKPKSQNLVLKEATNLLVDKSKVDKEIKEIIQGSLDIIILLEVESDVCVNRSILRRIDPNNNNLYHLEDNPPPNDNKVLDRLKPIDDPINSRENLKKRHLELDMQMAKMKQFFLIFGFSQFNFKTLVKIQGHRTRDSVSQDMTKLVQDFLKILEEIEVKIIEKKQEELINQNRPNSPARHEPTSSMGTVITNQLNINSMNIAEISINQNASSDEFSLQNPMPRMPTNEEIKLRITNDVSENLFRSWSRIALKYSTEIKQFMKFQLNQNERLLTNFNRTQTRFLDFLKKPNRKGQLIEEYRTKYVKFVEDYPELKNNTQVKEEHLQNIDELNDKLWEIIDSRKNKAIEERKNIIASNWIEEEINNLFLSFVKVFQCEIDLFLGEMSLIRNFYFSLENKITLDYNLSYEIDMNELMKFPIENGNIGVFPRLEKLFKIAIKCQYFWDQKMEISKDKEKTLNITISRRRSNNRVRKFPTNKEAPLKIEEIVKFVCNQQKAKFRQRIFHLKYYFQRKLKSMRTLSNYLYEVLDNWIIECVKCENNALIQLTTSLRNEVERDARFRLDIDMNPFDATITNDSHEYLFFEDEYFANTENSENRYFDFDNLRVILEELKSYEIQPNFVRIGTFIDVYSRKYQYNKQEKEFSSGVPVMIQELPYQNTYKFIRLLDFYNKDVLEIDTVSTLLFMVNIRICNENDIESIIDQTSSFLIDNYKLEKEKFLQIKFWFDHDYQFNHKHKYETNNNSLEEFKRHLYEINKDDEGFIIIKNFIRIISLENTDYALRNSKEMTYFEFLFKN